MVHRSRVGILLAYASLTIIIHAHNNSCIVAGKRMVQCISTHPHTNSSSSETRYSPVGVCPKTRYGIQNSIEDMDQWDKDESEIPSPDELALYHNTIGKVVLARAFKRMNLVHLYEKTNTFKLILPDGSSYPDKVGSNLETSDIQRKLLVNGLVLKYITPDGNCFFSSVATSILNAPVQWSDCLMRIGYVENNEGLPGLTLCLRNAFVQELLKNRERYIAFLERNFQINYEMEAKRFLQNGFFDGVLGDCMPRAMSAVLQAPVVVFSDIATEPQCFAIPDVITSNITIILVHRSELNHYDAAVPVSVPVSVPDSASAPGSADSRSVTTQPSKADVFCSCGVNKKGTAAKSCCQSPIYSTRCKCFKKSQPCTSQCRCINCDNINGKRPTNPKPLSRKRHSHQWQGELPTQKRFASDKGQDLQGGAWSDFETILLQEIHDVHNSIEDVFTIFNNLVVYSKSFTCSIPLSDNIIFRQKNQRQIASKLEHLAKNNM